MANSDEGVSGFQISGESLINENCHNSRNSNKIDIELGPVTKLDNKNTVTSKKFDSNFMSTNYVVIIIFVIYDEFVAIRKPDSGRNSPLSDNN